MNLTICLIFTRTQFKLNYESVFYNDIIQFNFNENYCNLVLKTIAAIRWTAINCFKARFVLKLDTDTYLRPKLFLNQIQNLSLNNIYGAIRAPRFSNNRFGKYCIYPLYFPYKTFPPAVITTYLIPGSLFSKLYQAIVTYPQTLTIPALPVEDIYLSILAYKAKIKLVHFHGLLWKNNKNKCNLLNCTSKSIYIGSISDQTIIKYWNLKLI